MFFAHSSTGRACCRWEHRLEAWTTLIAATGRFKSYRNDPSKVPTVCRTTMWPLSSRTNTRLLWVRTLNGLNRFDPQTGQFTFYRANLQDPGALSNSKVNAIVEDRHGVLWVGTQSGIDQMDRGRGTFTTFSKKDGLVDNAIKSIVEDREGYLWLATENGLSRFDPLRKTFRNYSESDGLPASLLSLYGTEGSFRNESGEIVIGSSNGLTRCSPGPPVQQSYPPPAVLTGLLLFNVPVRHGANSLLHQTDLGNRFSNA